MDLVENDHLARKSELPDEEMLGRDDPQQRLVNRANTERRQQGALR